MNRNNSGWKPFRIMKYEIPKFMLTVGLID